MQIWQNYPIGEVWDHLAAALDTHGCAVLKAPTGSGKSTVLPLALLTAEFLHGKKIVMLEPRRIAAYAVAARCAANLDEELGRTVGYRMRLDRKISAATRLEVVTEGMLVRDLQRNPELPDVGLIIFDEVHERSIQQDLALALALEVRQSLRPDLKILAMSATIDTGKMSQLLDHAPVIESAGRSFPVEIRHFPRHMEKPLASEMAALIENAHHTQPGSILAFLPGEAEIRAVETLLQQYSLGDDTFVVPLYGRLDNALQRKAIQPPPAGMRKIVLATDVAESSLTIDGVRMVIDSGLVKVPRTAPGTGLTRLETVTISQASAAQRSGRAGRTEPGIAWRLWSSAEEARREVMRQGEIVSADLTELVLELAEWGTRDPAELCWLDPPPAAAWQAAQETLRKLGALDESGAITPHGRRIQSSGFGVRAGHLAVRAMELGAGHLGCRIAGLLEGFDFRKSSDSDFTGAWKRWEHDGQLAMARELAREGERRIKVAPGPDRSDISAGALLALAFPERVARRRGALGELRYLLANGRGAEWRETVNVSASEWLVAVELEDRGSNAVLRVAAPVAAWELEEYLPEQFATEIQLNLDESALTLEALETRRFGAIVWSEKRSDAPDRAALTAAVGTLLRKRGLAALEWPKAAELLRIKVAFARRMEPEGNWPDFSDAGLLECIEALLEPFLPEKFSKNMLHKIDLLAMLDAQLDYAQHRRLAALAPERIKLENGREFKVDYSTDPPHVAAKLQFFFGVHHHPALGNGKLPLTVQLLSPAGRPVQITNDLPGFWQGSYKLVRAELRGRYPKHDWPENP